MEDQDTEVNRKRERSPSFPYIELEQAIHFARLLYQDARMNEVRLNDAATSWDMSPKSGSLMRYLAALGQYGLLDASGGGADRRYKVSQAARRLFEDDRPGVKEKIIEEAALKPKLLRDLFLGDGGAPRWGKDRPTDSIAESVLKFDMNFTPDAAKRFLTIYDSAVDHVVESGTETTQVEPDSVKVGPEENSGSANRANENQQLIETPSDVHNRQNADDLSVDREVRFSEWFRARVGREKAVAVYYQGADEIGPKEIGKLIALLEAQKSALED